MKHPQLQQLLQRLETELRAQSLWQESPPSATALASTQPFCVDTLTLPQWLQFIFLPRLLQLISNAQPLPTSCSIAPMAEEYFKADATDRKKLIAVLAHIDALLQS